MKSLDALLWEVVFHQPFTGLRVVVFVLIATLSLILLAPTVRSRLPLSQRLIMFTAAALMLPISFIAEHGILSQPAVLDAKRIRESGICLAVVSATVQYGKGVPLLVMEAGGTPRYVFVPWEVRFAQAMSRALTAQRTKKGMILLGRPECRKKHREQDGRDSGKDEGELDEHMQAGVFHLEDFPEPYPDKVDLEQELPPGHP